MRTRPIAAPADAAAILRERARLLARPPQPAAAAGTIELLEFRLARAAYALEMRHVGAVLPLADLTPLPCTPAFVAGIVNVRGRVVAAIDIQSFLELPAEGLTDLHHIILLRADGMEFGLLADTIAGVRSHPAASLLPAPPALAGVRPGYQQRLTVDGAVLLDIERLLADPGLQVQDEANP